MTPCIKLLKKMKKEYKLYEYEHDSASHSYGEEAAQKLNLPKEQLFKTLVLVSDKKEFCVGIVPVSSKLNLKAMAKTLGTKKVSMADAKDVEKLTGYILGGVSPLGQKKRLKTILDSSAKEYEYIFVSAGRRGLDVALAPTLLIELLSAKFENIGDKKSL